MKRFNIPIFVPHEGCPFACVFCNQKRITGLDTSISQDDISEIIESHLKTIPKNNRYVEIAFFGGSFTGISEDKQEGFLEIAYSYVKSGDVDGIRLSTRPDYINPEILERLKKYGVTTVELGVQSMDDGVLLKCMRGHTADDVINASRMIKSYGIKLGLQMMTGLPSDTDENAILTAEKIIALKPDCVRIYPTLVLKDTLLCEMYKSGEYTPPTLSDSVLLCKKLLTMFRQNDIDVIRVALLRTDEICENSIVAGPFHSAFRELVEGEIYFDKLCEAINCDTSVNAVLVNSRDVSRAVGIGKTNIKRIKDIYGIDLKVLSCDDIERGMIKIWKE